MTAKDRTGRATSTAGRTSARERMAAARAADARRRRRRIVALAAGAAAVTALAAAGAWIGVPGRGSGGAHPLVTRTGAGTATGVPADGTARPPWKRPDDTAERARTAGLSVAPMEGTVRHFHAHLDVLVDGRRVPVPAGLGIAPAGDRVAELHTHDTTGVLHVEAPTATKRYVLGQLFQEWNVRLSPTALGGLPVTATRALTAYVDGRRQNGDPARIELAPHRQIALVYGPAGAKVEVPAGYDFPAGE